MNKNASIFVVASYTLYTKSSIACVIIFKFKVLLLQKALLIISGFGTKFSEKMLESPRYSLKIFCSSGPKFSETKFQWQIFAQNSKDSEFVCAVLFHDRPLDVCFLWLIELRVLVQIFACLDPASTVSIQLACLCIILQTAVGMDFLQISCLTLTQTIFLTLCLTTVTGGNNKTEWHPLE